MKHLALTIGAIAVVAGFVAKAFPHEFYDAICCNGDSMSGDCQPVPDADVRPVAGKWVIDLKPGDHRLVTVPQHFTIDQKAARRSPDGRFHACLWPDQAHLQCFYAPPYGM